jgi:hypothetical protein
MDVWLVALIGLIALALGFVIAAFVNSRQKAPTDPTSGVSQGVSSRLSRVRYWVVYGSFGVGVGPYYVNDEPLGAKDRYKFALTYAAEEHRLHKAVARRMQKAHVVFQGLTIAAAAVATVVAVKPPWANDWVAAVPAAIATLSAAAVATFRFERHWLRHRRAASGIDLERALFVGAAGAYEAMAGADAEACARATTAFIGDVNRISREGYEDLDERAASGFREEQTLRG